MLQQTQVSTVIPYYKRWLEVFPTLASLAQAPLSRALELWAGLGYYRRARMFHLAAQQVQKDRGGHIPKTARELRELPGIGRYTAGAIASIALGEKTPVLDGNVIRILSRIFALRQSVDLPETLERLWGLAASLLPESNPGDLNQAMMELGATVCFPLIPKCTHCPINKVCAARKKGRELSYPVRTRKDRYEKLRMAALVLKNSKNEVWLEKQPDQGRWGGLWMFPFWTNKREMMQEICGMNLKPSLFLTVPHAFTKYRIMLEVYIEESKKRLHTKQRSGKWFAITKLPRLALPSPHKKIAQAIITRAISVTGPLPSKAL